MMPLNARLGLCLLMVAPIFLVGNTTLCAQDDPPEVNQIVQRASRAQNASEFELAAGQWDEIQNKYPQSSQVGMANYRAGYCYVQLGQFETAAERLQRAIGQLDRQETVAIGQSYLFLGFSQSKVGRKLLGQDQKSASEWLTTATQTFITLLNKYPDFDDADQAYFFQGEAFEALGRLDKAAESYEKMLSLPKAEFKLDALFALAFIRSQQGRHAEALPLYRQFESDGAQHPAFNEVRFNAAETQIQLAIAAEQTGEKTKAREWLQAAAQKFAELDQAGDPMWRDQARFQQANCAQQLGQFEKSAQLYESILQLPGSKLAEQARVYAGRDYFRAGNNTAAEQILEKAVATSSPYAAQGAHWLAQLYLRDNQNEKAYQLTSQWVTVVKDDVTKAQLMLDQADAAYASKQRREESETLYLNIVEQFPSHSLADSALYNAAFAAMENRRFENALKLTSRFRTEYAQSDYLPDVLEVEGDSFLMAGNAASSEKTFAQLVSQFEQHPKAPMWKLRVGLAKYMQKQYEPTIAWLRPIVQQWQPGPLKAEALHWIGSSYYHLGQAKAAIASLNDALTTDANWRRADETLLTLSRSYYLAKNVAEAKATTKKLIDTFPQSNLIAEASYRLGEFDYDAGQFDTALTYYTAVVENHPQSSFAPYSWYGIGWAQLQRKEFEKAIAAFTQLTTDFPQHALAQQALIGRASGYRQSAEPSRAVSDITAFLKTGPAPGKKVEALYELGLAQIMIKQWPAVINTFEELIELAPKAKLADRFHYELAWALRANNQAAKALQHFATIASQWPKSDLAAESNFHVAQDAYQRKEYESAANAFKTCLALCKDAAIREKAIYKLAWTYYKMKDFNNALASFRQQITEFPKGSPLYADAVFMVSESLYENKDYNGALQQYRVARPVIETSTTVSNNYKILTFLHGAQSANQAKEYQTALDFAKPLLDMDIDKFVKQEAQMEIGDAYRSLGEPQKAIAAYEQATAHPGKTGARSMCMIGEILFDQKNFPAAINKFKLVLYDYGGTESTPAVKPWQAFAAYEAGRCNMVQITATNDQRLRQNLVAESIKHFEYLVTHFPNDKLTTKAQSHLKQLRAAN